MQITMDLKRLTYSLTGKLILTIGAMMITGNAILLFCLLNQRERELIDNSIRRAINFVEIVKRSIDYGMLTNHRTMVQHTVESIAQTNEVMLVRIFTGKGRIAYSSRKEDIGKILDANAPICKSCHSGPGTPIATSSCSVIKSPEGYKILTTALPINNQMKCYTSTCHAHSQKEKVLGKIEVRLSLQSLDTRIKQGKITLTLYVLGALVISAVVLSIILWNIISKPLRILTRGMRQVTEGNLECTVNIDTKDEIGEHAKVFNVMTSELSKTKKELVEWGQTLEKKVQEKKDEIQKAQAQLVHSAKLASLGRMAAGVAHEINNPLTGVVSFSHLLRDRFPEGSQEREDIEVIIEQANRCSNIIKGLLSFARATTADKGPVNINEILKNSLNMVRHKADFFNINIVLDLDESLSLVNANSSQIQQVFLNMIINAADAMEGKGTLTLCTRKVTENGKPFAEVEFTDTGQGIYEEDITKLFEPFFTTKPVGKGTGLGLAISHGIIHDHAGNISVKSKVGEGTSFFVRLPLYEG